MSKNAAGEQKTSEKRPSAADASRSRIRVLSYVLVIAALLLVAAGLSGINRGVAADAWVLVIYGAYAAVTLALGIVGFSISHGSRKLVPAVVLCGAGVVGSLLALLFVPYGEQLAELTQDTHSLLSSIICILAILVMWFIGPIRNEATLSGELREGEGSAPKADPEYVPESMVQTGAAAPFAPTGARVPRKSARTGAPLLLLFNAGTAAAAAGGADIVDAHGNLIFRVVEDDDQARTVVEDAAGNQVAEVRTTITAGRGAYGISMSNGDELALPLNLAGADGDVPVEGFGWKLRGNDIGGFDFEVVDAEGHVIARARKQLTAAQKTRGAVIYDRAHADQIVAVLVVARGLAVA